MRPTSLIFALMLILSGCAASAAHDPVQSAAPSKNAASISSAQMAVAAPASSNSSTPQLTNTQWQFARVAGKDVPSGVNATLIFNAGGHASGHAGCNSYGAPYQSNSDGGLHFGGVLSTKMACLQPAGAMQTERAVFDALRRSARAQIRNGDLVLLDASGGELATLQAKPAP